MIFTRQAPQPIRANQLHSDDYWAFLAENDRLLQLREQQRRRVQEQQALIKFSQGQAGKQQDKMFRFDVRRVHDDYFRTKQLRMSLSSAQPVSAPALQAPQGGVWRFDVFSSTRGTRGSAENGVQRALQKQAQGLERRASQASQTAQTSQTSQPSQARPSSAAARCQQYSIRVPSTASPPPFQLRVTFK